MKKKLALCVPLSDEDRATVEKYCDITECGFLTTGKWFMDEDVTYEQMKGNEIIVTMSETTGAETLKKLKDQGLKFVIAARGTPTMTDWKACHDLEIPLGYTPGRNKIAVAEFCVMFMLMLSKKVKVIMSRIQNGMYLGEAKENVYDYIEKKDVNWPHNEGSPFGDIGYNHELYGKTVGLVGFGAIGREVAKICKAFHMDVCAYDAYLTDEQIAAEGVKPVSIDELLTTSDIVSVHLPVTNETRFMINEDWFAKMKPTALFINTARAAVIKQEAVVHALESGQIAGAAMDVFWEEPIPENHPLLSMDNVIVTPHMAAMTEEIDNYWTSRMVTDHIVEYCEGKELTKLWTRLE
jgi:D-3-phosphoglycerate dehydrogenase / 2-oxoglutarate reductase